MHAYDFEAVVYDGAVYCHNGKCFVGDVNADEVMPIFADSEHDHYPVCAACGAVHTYVGLTVEGRRMRNEWLAGRHNMEVWEERISTIHCPKCGDSEVPHDSAHATDQAYCPSCEAQLGYASITDGKHTAWWFWCCSPGCLPEGPPVGPYQTRDEALADAVDGFDDE